MTIPSALYYTNKEGRQIGLQISHHALDVFVERWNRLFPAQPLAQNMVIRKFSEEFSQAIRWNPKKPKDVRRNKKHGNCTVYYRTSNFTFIIEDCTIVTVEISSKGNRPLNNPYSLCF